ncbi:hypothetical protein FDECE_17016 [Fusarium decemcellulare]|nr:hypothetical protein FDECE_17016 [Fusarium decemcellulare]
MTETKVVPDRDVERDSAPGTTPIEKAQSQDGSVVPEAIQALDWDGPDDPENPMNWPVWKKIMHSAIPAVYAFGLTTGISTLVAGIPGIMLQFDKTRNMALLPICLYTAGFVFGPCIAAPISELHGRRVVYRANFVMLIVFNAIAVASDNFVVLVLFRFLAGLGGSGVMAVGAGTLSDLWEPKEVGRVGVAYLLAPFLGPSMGPLIGAYTVHHYDTWKWAVWVVFCILAPVGIGIACTSETSKPKILYNRAKKRGTNPVSQGLVSELQKIGKAMVKPWHMCVIELTGILFGLATFVFFDLTKYQKEVIRTGDKVAPEHRLYAALFGSWLVPIGLFWYAWAPRESVHWIVPVLAGIPFGWGTIASFLACLAYLAVTYGPADLASAVAANGILRFSLGTVFPVFIIQVYENLGIHWAGSLFAFISVAFIPVPWLFFWKGRELRKRSHYETSPY